jgi:mannose-6-phosphate isomerase-like protein (cupin superfamily)
MRIVRCDDRPYQPASHEDPKAPGVLKRVLAAKEELLPGAVQMINWALLRVGKSFSAHYHEDMEEIFVIVGGNVEMEVDGQCLALGRGDAIFIAPGEVHRMLNVGHCDVDYVVVGVSLGQGGRTVICEGTEPSVPSPSGRGLGLG